MLIVFDYEIFIPGVAHVSINIQLVLRNIGLKQLAQECVFIIKLGHRIVLLLRLDLAVLLSDQIKRLVDQHLHLRF